jgi:signal peptidase I
MIRWLWGWTRTIVQALVIWFVVTTFLVEPFRVWPTGSMRSTLLVNDFLAVNKLLYGAEVPLSGGRLPALREPARGDIVVLRSVEDRSLKLVKRLIGLPGDTLAMHGGVLWRNGRQVAEPYATTIDSARRESAEMREKMRAWQVPHLAGPDPATYRPDVGEWGPLVVPRDSLFFLGDNRDSSYDSRYYGFVPRANVLGHPFLVYFSFDGDSWRPLPAVTAVRWERLFSLPH